MPAPSECIQHRGLRRTLAPLLAMAMLAVSACAATPPPRAGTDATLSFVVVRHAEKVPDGTRDPALTDAGHARAQALAARLQGVPLRAAYSSDYQRTRDTGGPAAHAHGLALQLYDVRQPAAELAAKLRAAHAQGTVLVVGHSDTVPDIVAALCDCTPAPMDETEYDRYTEVRFDAAGKASLHVDSYGAPSATP